MSTITYIVKVVSSKFEIDGASAPKLTFRDGDTYIFDQSDSSNSGHTLQFSITSNNSGSSEYTTGVTKTGTAGSATAQTQIVTSSSTTDTIYYYSGSGSGDYGEEFSNTGFNTSTNFNFLKPIVGAESTAEKWGPMVNHMVDQIDQNISGQDLDGATDSGTVAVDLDTQSLTVTGSNGIATSGSGQTITVSGEALAFQGEPHIIPDVLYPAWSGLLDNHTGYTFTDSSATGHAITPAGGVHHSGSDPKFETTSLKFDGSTNAYISMTGTHADFDFQAADFTIEYWAKRTKAGAVQFHFGWGGSDGNEDVAVRFQADNTILVYWRNSSGTLAYFSPGFTVTDTDWHHYAYVRNGTLVKFAKDGVFGATTQTVGTDAVFDFDSDFSIGRFGEYALGLNFEGYIDDFRITKGLAVYTGNFTAPASTLTTTWSAGTNIAANSTASNVKLLIHSDNGGNVGAYGTEQADGRKYYYTDIKGSKPIKDPRIGAHFGSQRHRVSSLQLLEQETATHGMNVYSIDGREWMRVSTSTTVAQGNNTRGTNISVGNVATDSVNFEIVGYFNDVNILMNTDTAFDQLRVTLNGGTLQATDLAISVEGPLHTRYVRSGSAVNLTFNSTPTLGINTVKISNTTGNELVITDFELIAQDTTSTATKSKIQIPSQNVVSYGKKFTVSGTPHYDPFNGFTSGSSVTAYVDTATSLGIEGWKNSSTYYRPYNGGRVVKWVDSSGTIKTSVNMMPPNARSIGNSSSLTNATAKANASVANNTFYPTMEAGAIDHSQAEIAKSFYIREFGNGSANGNASYEDLSTLNTADDRAYVMDDGLTSVSSTNNRYSSMTEGLHRDTSSGKFYHTFIGTGIGRHASPSSGVRDTWAQNLPYGTHILAHIMDGTSTSDWFLDGIQIYDNSGASSVYHNIGEQLHIHQPKRPPIPEDACILMDVMLMADFVPTTSSTLGNISKGVRLSSGSRDTFYDSGTTISYSQAYVDSLITASSLYTLNSVSEAKLPAFATSFGMFYDRYSDRYSNVHVKLDGSTFSYDTNNIYDTNGDWDDTNADGTIDKSASNGPSLYGIKNLTLGLHTFGDKNETAVSGDYNAWGAIEVGNPIHTSSHYQTFETPFLHELVGGDRNMEQTNLVVTPDGKTWDEVTRDTSYIGDMVVSTSTDTAGIGDAIMDEWRGVRATTYFNKDFAIAYDRMICLVAGEYKLSWNTIQNSNVTASIVVNGTTVIACHGLDDGSAYNSSNPSINYTLKRGDYVKVHSEVHDSIAYNLFQIERV